MAAMEVVDGNPHERILEMVQALNEEVNRQTDELAKLQAQNDEILKANQELRTSLRRGDDEAQARQSELEELCHQVAALRSQHEADQDEIRQLKEELAKRDKDFFLGNFFRRLFPCMYKSKTAATASNRNPNSQRTRT